MRQQAAHVRKAYRHAPLGRPVALTGDMEEDRRAAMTPARGDVPVEHEADVVKPVLAHHLLMAAAEGRPHEAVIASIVRLRSEDRRLGKECVGTVTIRWSPDD